MIDENVKIETKIHSVKYNFAMNIILKISQYVFPLITTPYITRVLGAMGNGKVAFATSIVSYFSIFAQLGIPTYAIRACACCRDDKDKLTKTVHEIVVINMLSVAITYVIFIWSIMSVPKLHDDIALLLMNSITIFLNMVGMEWLYQATEQYQYITIRNITFKIITIVLMFLLVHKPQDYMIYGFLTIFSSCGSYALNMINSRKMLKRQFYFGEYHLKKHLKPIITYFALSIAVTIYTSMDTVMLGFMTNDIEVAYYNLATKVKIILATSISALGPVLLPRLSYYLKNDQIEKYENYLRKSVYVVVLASIPVTVFAYLLAPEVIDILGGNEYLPAISCMQVITLAIIPLGLGNIATTQILTPMNREGVIMKSTICGAVLNLVANFLLIPKIGANGAAVATVIAETVVASIQLSYSRDVFGRVLKKIHFDKIIISNVMALIVLFIYVKLVFFNSSVYALASSCVLYFGTYIFVLILLKDELVQSLLQNIISKFKR